MGPIKWPHYTQNKPGTRGVLLRREVISAVCGPKSSIIQLVAGAFSVLSITAPPQTTLRLMASTLAVVAVRRLLQDTIIQTVSSHRNGGEKRLNFSETVQTGSCQ